MAIAGFKTYHEEMRERHPNRPYVTRPTWELQNMRKALSMLMWQNTEEETQRLEDVTKELRIRKRGGFVR